VAGAFVVAALFTAPPSAARPHLIATAGDIACDSRALAFNGGLGTASRCRQRATSDLLVGRGYDAVLALGDNQYRNGDLEQFRASYEPSWGRVRAITRPVVGNHEYNVPAARGYFDYFNGIGVEDGPAGDRDRGYYSFDLGRWHLVALNSNCREVACEAGSAQERWLRRDLRQSQSRCLLAYWHHPRFSSGDQGSSARTADLWTALQRAGADLVLSGHDHHYERFAPRRAGGRLDRRRGIRQFVVGTGGKELLPLRGRRRGSRVAIDREFGILRMRLGRSGYRWRFKSVSGPVLDRGSDRCG
jgi:hypothetical protein